MIVKCPYCGTKLKLEGEEIPVSGQHILCPCCNKKFVIDSPARVRVLMPASDESMAKKHTIAPVLLKWLYIIGTVFCVLFLLAGWCNSILHFSRCPSVGELLFLVVFTMIPILLWIFLCIVCDVFIAIFDIESSTRTCASLMRRLVSEQNTDALD